MVQRSYLRAALRWGLGQRCADCGRGGGAQADGGCAGDAAEGDHALQRRSGGGGCDWGSGVLGYMAWYCNLHVCP